MNQDLLEDLSSQLKAIAKDLSFLGHPRYNINELLTLFPQHHVFIQELEDISTPFNVDVAEKKRSMDDFETKLATADIPQDIKNIFSRRLKDYRLLLSMMENFGTSLFYENCVKLYGNSEKSMGNNAFFYFLEQMPSFTRPDESTTTLEGEDAFDYLKNKLLETFVPQDFEVKASTSLLSDSSAGRRTLKLNPFKTYSTQHLDIFLVHEGWAHLGTSLNGAAQEKLPWLSTWAPRTTYLQEGLAVLTELITGSMTSERWNKIVLRHLACSMAERGSKITDVYAYLRHHGMENLDAFKLALRVYRGVPLEGGMAFTKELLYLHGLIEVLYHLQIHQADLESLWIGKVSFEEHLIVLKNWNEFQPRIKYFPEALKSEEVKDRLQKLKDLSISLFHRGFLQD